MIDFEGLIDRHLISRIKSQALKPFADLQPALKSPLLLQMLPIQFKVDDKPLKKSGKVVKCVLIRLCCAHVGLVGGDRDTVHMKIILSSLEDQPC